jgi:hypothetical protein
LRASTPPPVVSCSVWASSSLLATGELPRQGSSTCVAQSTSGRAPPLDLQTLIPALKVAAVTRRPRRPVSFKATLKVVAVMRHGAEMTRMQLDLL